jgi:hypothetical protein
MEPNLYHLRLHDDPERFHTRDEMIEALQKILHLDAAECEVIVDKSGMRDVMTLPFEPAEYFAIAMSKWGAFGFKISLVPLKPGIIKTYDEGPCFISHVSDRFFVNECPKCAGLITHSEVRATTDGQLRYWFCESHAKWLLGMKDFWTIANA